MNWQTTLIISAGFLLNDRIKAVCRQRSRSSMSRRRPADFIMTLWRRHGVASPALELERRNSPTSTSPFDEEGTRWRAAFV
ncbi:MAG: hypothetical protein ACLSHC_17580 [Bilophila wadsworthia]